MKTFWKIILWIFAVIGMLMILLIIILANALPSKPKVKIHDNTYLELSLGGLHYDYNEYEDIFHAGSTVNRGHVPKNRCCNAGLTDKGHYHKTRNVYGRMGAYQRAS